MAMTTPERLPLIEMTLRQLRRVASAVGISRYSRMRKEQLLDAIQLKNPGGSHGGVETNVLSMTVREELADVDMGLGDLPVGYGESQIMLLPRDPQWAYAYWDIPNERKAQMRAQGGQQLALRLYDVTDLDVTHQAPHSVQEYGCDEMAREWYLPVPVSDREYALEIGYRGWDGRWLVLARSNSMRVPPVYPSDWIEDHFVTVPWNVELEGKTVLELVPPSRRMAIADPETSSTESSIHNQMTDLAAQAEAMRVAGSLMGEQHVAGSIPAGSIQHLETLSSYVFPSGVGMWAMPNVSGLNMSGIGMGASMPPAQPRKFWLIADAELIVYGATEPDATVYVDGEPITLSPDGTFRFQMSFQDGQLRFPIVAVAADGEQTRSVSMDFERQTYNRNTNTKVEAVEEWFPVMG
jgi:uncharacterized protein